MAEYPKNVVETTRLLAIAHIVIGTLLICFGIADRVVEYYEANIGIAGFGIWIGTWMCITGGLGIPGSERLRTRSRNVFVAIFMGFSITSTVFGGIIIIAYSSVIANFPSYDDYLRDRYWNDYYYSFARHRHAKLFILAVMLILGIATFQVGIWTAICCCMLKPCCAEQEGQQMMNTQTNPPAGYVMTDVSCGSSVAVPVQTGGCMVASQGVQPISDASGAQPVSVHAASSDAMALGSPSQQVQPPFVQINPPSAKLATGSQPQRAKMPHSYGRVEFVRLQNEEIE